jgi:hypothetical protein
MMFASEIVRPEELATYLPEHRAAWKGVEQARDALALATTASRSPQETRLRMIWIRLAKLPPPLVNRPVFALDGSLLAIPDLLEPESATIAEFDGEQHRGLIHHAADNEREERLEDCGFSVVRVTSLDLRRADRVSARLKAAVARGLARDRSRDRWLLTPPAWYARRSA